MKTLHLLGQIDERHRLSAEVPPGVAPGPVKVVIVLPSETESDAETAWTDGVAREWSAELTDPREDIYTLNDGAPVDGSRWEERKEFKGPLSVELRRPTKGFNIGGTTF